MKVSGGKEGTLTPISSHPIEGSEKEFFFVGDPTTSRKKKDTQSLKISPISILKDKR
jgi:hypothetical protein